MSVLTQFSEALAAGSIEVIDLTSPLSPKTPVIKLPEQFGQSAPFAMEKIAHFDDRGPAWSWSNIHTGEHTGTHFDAPNHWITGRDLESVDQVAPGRLVRPAAVLDFSEHAAKDPDFLLTRELVEEWVAEHGPLPRGGWLLYRTGWDQYSHDQDLILNADDDGAHTPGIETKTAQWLAEENDVIGLGVETVGTDAGQAPTFEPMFPCHAFGHGAGKYGITQLKNLDKLPPQGAIIITAPLPIVGGTGSPARILALVER